MSLPSNVLYALFDIEGKLTALWPFLGIVVEIVLLAVIIIVFEKNQRKKKKLQSISFPKDDNPQIETMQNLE